MVCDDVRRVMYFYLDGTLSGSKTEVLLHHLHDCVDCERRIDVHRRIRSFVKKRLQPVPAPPGLRERISGSFRLGMRRLET